MKVLLTGANGYIGRRLKQKLLNENVSLRILVRNPKSIGLDVHVRTEVFRGDTFDKHSLENALEGIDVAYYLIHSLQHENYRELDKTSAQNFLDAAIKQGVKRIIYLGGLGIKEHASEYLLSRIETGEILSSRPDQIQTIWFRAGVIIGSGSASFEIIRHLVEKLPVMITPTWVNTLAQPIGVDDVVSYLSEAKGLVYDKNLTVDIGSEKMTYKEMMLGCADALKLKRFIFPLPVVSIKISSFWLNIFTPVPYNLAKSLIEGLSSEVVVQNDHAKRYFPRIHPCPFKNAVLKAIKEMEHNQILSRWSDAGGGIDLWEEHRNDPSAAILTDRQRMEIKEASPEAVYRTFCAIGGKEGWFSHHWLWEIRGWFDKMIGGAGLKRGRRHQHKLRVGESVDFWRVEDLVDNERLLLRAQMKVPGKAWLEFKIQHNELIQTAYFYPKGLWGRVYWYVMIPAHYFIFRSMIAMILKRAKQHEQTNFAYQNHAK